MKKITLTSTLAILIAGPAIAAVGDTTFTTGQNVENSCVVGVLGVDTGTAQTNAYWNPKTYACDPGTYLPDGDTWTSEEVTADDGRRQCPAGSYCAGSGQTPFTYSEANDQGIQSCGSTYSHSDAGSDSVDDCYRDCAVADVAHLKSGGSVTGRYYSTGTNECVPADDQQCTTGYHYVAGAPDLNAAIGTTYGSQAGINNKKFWIVYSDIGTINGKSQCSSQSGTGVWNGANNPEDVTTLDTLPDSTGRYCWCQLGSYVSGSSAQSLSAPWVYNDDDVYEDNCAQSCATHCTSDLRSDTNSRRLKFRAAMFGSLGSPVASCQANTVNINWKDASGETHELGECTYDGTLSTPTTAPTKRGHTFGGWKFVAQP